MTQKGRLLMTRFMENLLSLPLSVLYCFPPTLQAS